MNHLLKKLLFCAIISAAAAIQAAAQTQTIRGTVTEAGSGEPILGAVVMIDGASRGVMADPEGRYSIQARTGETLVCSLLGYANLTAEMERL